MLFGVLFGVLFGLPNVVLSGVLFGVGKKRDRNLWIATSWRQIQKSEKTKQSKKLKEVNQLKLIFLSFENKFFV